MNRFFHRAPICLCLLVLVITCWTIIPANAEDAKLTQLELPFIFEQNQGQVPNQYLYRAQRDGIETRYLTSGVDLFVPQTQTTDHLQIRWRNANSEISPAGEQKLPGHSNYLRGNDPTKWLRDIPQFSHLIYKELYPGIDLVFHGNGDYIEHDFIVRPSFQSSQIELQLDKPARLDSNGDLEIDLGKNSIRLRKPIAYQEDGSTRKQIAANFVLSGGRTIKFRVGSYDHTRNLVIDPVFVFSTYLAGTGADQITGLATDASGNVYATGNTTSIDFPVKDALQSTCSSCGNNDVFVSKFDPTGHTLLYSTYLGGSNGNFGGSIKVDNNGNIILVGLSGSNDFPHAGSLPALTCQINAQCYFITSLKSDGSAFNYSGLVGGQVGFYTNGNDGQLAVDGAGNAYLAGLTDDQHFQFTSGTLGHNFAGYPNSGMFVLKVGPGGALLYSAVVAGSLPFDPANAYNNLFMPNAILVNNSGQATIAGFAGTGLPTTPGVVQGTFPNSTNAGGPSAGFVLQLNAAATAINFATYIPGTESVTGMARDVSGNYYLGGWTAENNLPVSSNAYQKNFVTGQICGCVDGFVLKLDSLGKNVLGATYISSNPNDNGTSLSALVLDSHSNVFFAGYTATQNFPMKNPFVTVLQSSSTIGGTILGELDSGLSSLQFGSYLSSTSANGGSRFSALAMDSQDHPIVAGITWATDFPTTVSSFQPVLPAPSNPLSIPYHSFISELDMATPAPSACLSALVVDFGSVNANTAATKTVNLTNCGNAPLHISSIVASSPTVVATQSCGALAPDAVCSISLKYTPVDSSGLDGTVTIVDDAAVKKNVIVVEGQGKAAQLTPFPSSVTFSPLLVGTQGADVILFINNTGTSSLTITQAAISGDFSVSQNNCNFTVPAFSGCNIAMVFAPTAAGTRHGTLTLTSNDPLHPQLAIPLTGTGVASYPVPVITSFDSSTLQIGVGTVIVKISGTNFFPASVVRVNGVPQTASYVDGATINVTLDDALVANIGELSVTVFNPAPAGGESNAATLTLYRTLVIEPVFMASVPATHLLYASIGASATAHPNTIIPIDPTDGSTKTPLSIGNNPRFLAASDDGKYLYVELRGDQKIKRVNLQTMTVERTFDYPILNASLLVSDMHVVPGQPQSLVVSFNGTVTLYNDNGLVNSVNAPADSFAFVGNPVAIYSLPLTAFQNHYFNIINLTNGALQYTPLTGTNFGPDNETGLLMTSDGGRIYTSSGEVWDPASHALLASFGVPTINVLSAPNETSLMTDKNLGQSFYLGDVVTNGLPLMLFAYSNQNFQPVGSLAFQAGGYPIVANLSRWGTDGFAFLASGRDQADQEVYILRSKFSVSTAHAALSTTSLAFDDEPVGESSPATQVTLSNSGSQALSINGINATGDFTQTNDCASSLAPTATCHISVTFTPTAGGTRTGMLSIDDNASGSPHVVSLSGNGIAPNITIGSSEGGMSSSVRAGQPATYTLSVSGSPGLSGTVSLTCSGAPLHATCSVSPTSATLTSGNSTSFTVTVTTGSASVVASAHNSPTMFSGLWLISAFLPLLVFARSKSRKGLAGVAVLLVGTTIFLGGLTACGGGSGSTNPPPPPPSTNVASGTYTLNVTATVGTVSSTQHLTLIVQ